MRKAKCRRCDKMAVWLYMPGPLGTEYCDDHVPRGCSCNLVPPSGFELPDEGDWDSSDWIEDTDEQGKLLPCCEYMYDEEGLDIEDEDLEKWGEYDHLDE